MSKKKSTKDKRRLEKLKANYAKQQAYQANIEEQRLAPIKARQHIYQRFIVRLELERNILTDASLLSTLPCITQEDIDEIRKDGLNIKDLREKYHQGTEEMPFQEWLAEQGH